MQRYRSVECARGAAEYMNDVYDIAEDIQTVRYRDTEHEPLGDNEPTWLD